MKTYRKQTCVCLAMLTAVCITSHGQCMAEPSEGIQALLDTPATAFDVYLHQLSIELNGQTYFGGPARREDVRLYQLDYDKDSNQLFIGMHISPSHELLEGFSAASPALKKNILLTAAKEMAMQVGIEEREGMRRKAGAIQNVQIRPGQALAGLDENAIRDEIAGRTEFDLAVPIREAADGQFHGVRRTIDGQYTYQTEWVAPRTQRNRP